MSELDLDFRPATYFGPQALERYLLGRVKGVVARRRLQALFDQGRHEEALSVVDGQGLDPNLRQALERFHPMFMGGNYLPDTQRGEVVIASVTLASTLSDVTCVYARFSGGRIHYRVVDEFERATLSEHYRRTSMRPLSLKELATFFLRAWNLFAVLDANWKGDLERQLRFFRSSSDYYPGLDDYLRLLVRQRFERSSDVLSTNAAREGV